MREAKRRSNRFRIEKKPIGRSRQRIDLGKSLQFIAKKWTAQINLTDVIVIRAAAFYSEAEAQRGA